MRRNTLMRLLAVSILVIAATLATSSSRETADAYVNTCQVDVLFIGARGSGQVSGLGRQVQAVYDSFLSQAPAEMVIKSYDLDTHYPSIDVVEGYLKGQFDSSIEAGRTAMVTQIRQAIHGCPNPPSIVMVGYSQGAEVVKLAAKSLTGAELGHVGAILAIADPRYHGLDGAKNLGDAQINCHVYLCLEAGIRGVLQWEIGHSQIFSLCIENDPICDWVSTDFYIHTDLYQLPPFPAASASHLWAGVYLTQHIGDIVRWQDGTSWQIQANGTRHWIAEGGTYQCLVASGARVFNPPSVVLDNIPDANGQQASCDSSGSGVSDIGPGIGGHYLPFPEGTSHVVTQAPGGQYSHPCPGNSCQAIDFAMQLNDPIVASANGTLFYRHSNHPDFGAMVMLEHEDGYCSLYGHMNSLSSLVNNAQVGSSRLLKSQRLGGAGDTGHAFGVHLHYALVDCQTWQSVNVDFYEIGNPQAWSAYTSQNAAASFSYDGDSIADRGVYNTDTGQWKYKSSLSGQWITYATNYGGAGWTAVPGDYDGGGLTDRAVYNSTTGKWKYRSSETGKWETFTTNYGGAGWTAVPGDYDGGGLTDRAVYNSTTGKWKYRSSETGKWVTFTAKYGGTGRLPAQGDYDGDGITDRAVYVVSDGQWKWRSSKTGAWKSFAAKYGGPNWLPAQGDYDGDGITDRAIYRPSDGAWQYRSSLTGQWVNNLAKFGGPNWLPASG